MATNPTRAVDIDWYRQKERKPILRSTTGAIGHVTPIDQLQSKKPAEILTAPIDWADGGGAQIDSTQRRLTHAELYPARHAFSPQHITALRLLTLAIGRFQRAAVALTSDPISADTEIQKVQALLPELFCCRELGDGFGTIINGIMSAFESLEGNTPSPVQLGRIIRVLRILKEKPFLSPDEADDELELLESAGLSVYPSELIDFLSSE